MGASLGSNSSLIAASTSEPPVDAVVAISPVASTELEEAAGLLEMPVLLVTTQDDPIGSSCAATELLFDLLLGERQVLILSGDLHGYDLLFNPDDEHVGWVLRFFLEHHIGAWRTETSAACPPCRLGARGHATDCQADDKEGDQAVEEKALAGGAVPHVGPEEG